MRWATGAAFVVVVLVSLLYVSPIYQAVGSHTVLWINDLTVIVSALTGVGLSFLLWRSFSWGEASKTIWASLTLGLFLWTLGEGISSYDQLLLGERLPYPSAADAAWILGYIPVALGLFLRYRSFQITPRKRWQVATLWAFAGLAILAVVFVIWPIIVQGGVSTVLEQAVNLLYPVGDLIVAFAALLLVLVLIGGALSVPWGLIAAGCLCVALSDLLYAFAVWQGLYQVDPASGVNFLTFLINVLYAASYVIVALGLYRQACLQKVI